MWSGKYEVVIVWKNDKTEIFSNYESEEAENLERDFRMAFGNQIEWSCVRKEYV